MELKLFYKKMKHSIVLIKNFLMNLIGKKPFFLNNIFKASKKTDHVDQRNIANKFQTGFKFLAYIFLHNLFNQELFFTLLE
jgi:hypothetical protein